MFGVSLVVMYGVAAGAGRLRVGGGRLPVSGFSGTTTYLLCSIIQSTKNKNAIFFLTKLMLYSH